MTKILGISAYYHDSAAALLQDGQIIAAAQEERFTRQKHDSNFPARAVDYCLKQGNCPAQELDYIVFYDKPLLKFDRLLESYLAFAPAGLPSFLKAMPVWLKTKLHLPREIRRELAVSKSSRIIFTRHHESHAASAFYPSPFNEAAILTIDGVGEWETASIGIGSDNKIEMKQSMNFPHSLGLLYSAFTYFCGFRVNSGEYKLMGLAPYGNPRYSQVIRDKLIDSREDGSFAINMRYFDYGAGLRMTNKRFAELFGGPARAAESPITQREMDIAASIQQVTEEILLRMAAHVQKLTGMRKLCLAGGVALNCVANGKLRRSGIFDDIWIQPASGDAGGALGAAMFVQHQLLDNPRIVNEMDSMQGARLGPKFDEATIRPLLDKEGAHYHYRPNTYELLKETAKCIADGKVVGWFQGRMEFGPRALGARSILGDPRDPGMQAKMNLQIKFRESFRPFAPAILAECVADYFDYQHISPYMLEVASVSKKHQLAATKESTPVASRDLREQLQQPRSTVPAITHVDMSARIQTVDPYRHGRFYDLLSAFYKQTGCPLLINTSFNIRGEPIVGSPEDALRCFLLTDMDVLVLENFILYKQDQQKLPEAEREAYRKGFKLD
jgi:carbamoyltransferase